MTEKKALKLIGSQDLQTISSELETLGDYEFLSREFEQVKRSGAQIIINNVKGDQYNVSRISAIDRREL